MIEGLVEFLKDKNILILGFGREGETSYKFIREHLKDQKLTIADMNEVIVEDYPYLAEDKNTKLLRTAFRGSFLIQINGSSDFLWDYHICRLMPPTYATFPAEYLYLM